jgi:hypothetical protein
MYLLTNDNYCGLWMKNDRPDLSSEMAPHNHKNKLQMPEDKFHGKEMKLGRGS